MTAELRATLFSLTGKDPVTLLEELYALVPSTNCQGKCQNCCGPIDMSPVERERIEERGVHIPPLTPARSQDWTANMKYGRDGKQLWCTALNLDTGKCDIYDVRPMVCRLWGASESMPCEHGCKPVRMLSDIEAMDLLAQSMVTGGGMSEGERQGFLAFMQDPDVAPLMGRFIKGDPAASRELAELMERKFR